MRELNLDTETRQLLLVVRKCCESLSNAKLADLLCDAIMVDVPVLSPTFAVLSTIADRLRASEQ